MPTKTPTKYSVTQDYIVRSPDRSYKGTSAKQEFLNGRAEVRALPADATPDEVRERMLQLEWFDNAGYAVARAQFMQPLEEVN